MQVEILTKRQMQIEVAKAIEKREFKMQRLIDFLQKIILKLEEEVKMKGGQKTK